MAAQVTMKDVAKFAGVHHSTVSLCLKNSPRIPEATRKRVLEAAKQLGYQPHPYLSTLMHTRRRGQVGKSSEVLALVRFAAPGDDWRQWIPEFQEGIDSARQQAKARGFHLEEFQAGLTPSAIHRLADILYHRGIRGLLFAPFHQLLDTLPWPWERFAAVALGPSLQDPRVHRVRHHYFQAMQTALNECQRLGYRRIGFALKKDVNRKLEQRSLAPYLLQQVELPQTEAINPLLATTWDKATFLGWFRDVRPDAVILIGATEPKFWLTSEGFDIPGDVGLVSLNAPRSGPQTGIYQDWPMQGKRAVNLLLDLLEDNLYGLTDQPHLLIVNERWNPGTTVRPLASAEAAAALRRTP
jgi:LacI family transcriptional regulator